MTTGKHSRRPFLERYSLAHMRAALTSLGQLWQQRGSTFMTVTVMTVALLLPSGLYWLLLNLQQASQNWGSEPQISLFLQRDIATDTEERLYDTLQRHPDIAHLDVLSAEQALAEFQTVSGFDNVLEQLPENPLPAVFIVTPKTSLETTAALQRLRAALEKEPGVEFAELDVEWIKRLHGLLRLAQYGIGILTALFALAVLFIVSASLQACVDARRDEITIIKLVGGTHHFVRRPFLYTALWYGLFSSLCCLLTLAALTFFLQVPVRELAVLYHSAFYLHYLPAQASGLVIVSSLSLSFIGAWIAVARHLRQGAN